MKEDFKLPGSQVVVKCIHLDKNQVQPKPNHFQYQVPWKNSDCYNQRYHYCIQT